MPITATTTLADIVVALGLQEAVLIAVNDEYIDDEDRPLTDGDEITFFTHAAGGDRLMRSP